MQGQETGLPLQGAWKYRPRGRRVREKALSGLLKLIITREYFILDVKPYA